MFYLCIYCLSTCPDACNHDISVGVYAMLLVVLMLIIKEGRKYFIYGCIQHNLFSYMASYIW